MYNITFNTKYNKECPKTKIFTGCHKNNYGAELKIMGVIKQFGQRV